MSATDGLLDILTEAFPRASADQIESACWRLMARADTQRAEAEKRGAVKALRMADDRLLTERDELRAVRARHGWPMGVEDAARTVRSLADRIESGEVTL
jgi:hypothetical protein